MEQYEKDQVRFAQELEGLDRALQSSSHSLLNPTADQQAGPKKSAVPTGRRRPRTKSMAST